MIGTRIAHYEISAKLGQGGMGEVYRATDSRLGREVAIKVLPESFARDKERLARFEREAKTLATLNHPNVAGIYGLEQSGDSQAIVLELVEGEDLSERLQRGALSVDEALEVGKQIADALEAAHEKGIVHRDLKPGNITVSSDGQVKVLDFGLAKALADESGFLEQEGTVHDESPTLTDVYTQPGTILGTASYMSPEQARGKSVDKRSDIWAFGCVLFECLAGKKAFSGEDGSEILAGIIKGEPSWGALPADLPPAVGLLLRKCLNKDQRRRLHDIADARIDIEEVLSGSDGSIALLANEADSKEAKPWSVHPATAIGGILAAVLVTLAVMWPSTPSSDETSVESDSTSRRRVIPMFIGMEGSLSRANGAAARLSPDGKTLGFLFTPTGNRNQRRIHLRRFDGLETKVLESSKGAIDFRFSPDGEWVVFRTEGSYILKKISVSAGGPFQVVCKTGHGRGMDWSDDGWIVYSHSTLGGLYRARASGEGEPEQITRVSGEDVTHRWPNVLPGGKAVIFTAHTQKSFEFDDAKIMIQELPQGEARVLERGFQGRYLPSGHLVYVRRNMLFARAFDIASLEKRGPEIAVVQDVATRKNGVAHYDVSAKGDLVYLKGGFLQQLYALEWIDREGNSESIPYADNFLRFRVSPDGRFLASTVAKGDDYKQIWVYDLERVNPVQLTFDEAEDSHPVWSPTGGTIVFSRKEPAGHRNIYWIRTDASGQPERLLESDVDQIPYSWSRDGKFLAIVTGNSPNREIRVVELDGDDETGWTHSGMIDFRVTPFKEGHPQFSPNGDRIAYLSNETGSSYRVFVRAFPGGEGRQQISSDAEGFASWVRWSGRTNELLFGDRSCFIAAYSQQDERFSASLPLQWGSVVADDMFNQSPRAYNSFDVDPNGSRILVRRQVNDAAMAETRSHIVLFENFLDYLREKVPVTPEP